ncbi:unnamed protein product [Vitrella brassicaformis CCMP3155]|uniref:PH domain-containing protein n=1 Tax=Vitrella brassicaformis (strain CCMP3155) TaxID=1169540 RepID=A0A0G4G226_VITBC|nr:unnamed protein product [Vitrella brassicaformis CCMP3155]|eukprot:CEM22106.1 unnamed protein product [Vitrella brassicaformis CCMP3155]
MSSKVLDEIRAEAAALSRMHRSIRSSSKRAESDRQSAEHSYREQQQPMDLPSTRRPQLRDDVTVTVYHSEGGSSSALAARQPGHITSLNHRSPDADDGWPGPPRPFLPQGGSSSSGSTAMGSAMGTKLSSRRDLLGAAEREDPSAAVQRLQRDRQELMTWANKLMADMKELEAKNSRLERQIADERSRAKAHQEDPLLRRQVEMYASQIDSLQSEKFSADKAIEKACADMQADRDVWIERCRGLEVQRGEHEQQIDDLQKTVDELKGASSSLREELEQKSREVEVGAAALSLAEEQLSKEKEQREALNEALMRKEEERQALMTDIRSQIDTATQAHADKYTSLEETLKEKCTKVLAALERTESEMRQLKWKTQGIRGECRQQVDALMRSSTAEREALIEQLSGERERALGQVIDDYNRRCTALEQDLAIKDQLIHKLRHRPSRDPAESVSGELRAIMAGTFLRKAHFHGQHKRVDRFVQVTHTKRTEVRGVSYDILYASYVQVSSSLMLRWGTDPRRLKDEISLRDVVRVEYGPLARMQLWKPDESELSYRCFSLITSTRSYDFMALTDWECQAWVVGVSRLVSQWSAAVVSSRHTFLVKRSVMKVDELAREKETTRAGLLMSAIRRASLLSAPQRRRET